LDPEIGSIHYRAQDVQPGGMFVAIAGSNADGHDYIDEALSRGASAIVTQQQTRIDGLSIAVSDTRRALAMLAAAFYGNPSEQLVLIAITGTNGKTTTAYIIEGILQQAGYRVGVIGTINSGPAAHSGTHAAGRGHPCRHGGVVACHRSWPD
jgi:UDP-N-acetylmuramyl tripeptide synthase